LNVTFQRFLEACFPQQLRLAAWGSWKMLWDCWVEKFSQVCLLRGRLPGYLSVIRWEVQSLVGSEHEPSSRRLQSRYRATQLGRTRAHSRHVLVRQIPDHQTWMTGSYPSEPSSGCLPFRKILELPTIWPNCESYRTRQHDELVEGKMKMVGYSLK